MLPLAKHDTLVLSDSDIAVGRRWLAQVTAALVAPGRGHRHLSLYRRAGPGGDKLWSSLAAMGTSYDFLPNAVVGTSLGLASPCMGSTIALRRETLDEVGGFAAFADQLADDYEMGRAVRAKGYTLAIPAMGVGHTAAEDSLAELFRHELRWTRTIRMVNRGGHLGSIVTHGFAFALMAALLLDFNTVSLARAGLHPGRPPVPEIPHRRAVRHLCRALLADAGARPAEFCGVRGLAVRRNRALARHPLCGRAFRRDVAGLTLKSSRCSRI